MNTLSQGPPRTVVLLKRFFLITLTLLTFVSSIIALIEGTHRLLYYIHHEVPVASTQTTIDALRAKPDIQALWELSPELWGLSKLSNPQRFIESRLPEQAIYYASMPLTNKILLLTHALLSSFCILCGVVQFWSAFRTRHMRMHRLLGGLYIATAPPAVVLSLIYLLVTAPHNIYDHLLAWIALWIFGLLAIIAVVMALVAIRARRIHEHQSWMALSFSCLMVAPILRWNWAWLAWIFPTIDQQTLNLVTLGLLLPEYLLIAYALLLINRRPATRPRAAMPPAIAAARLYTALLPLLQIIAVALGALVLMYFIQGGLSGRTEVHNLLTVDLIQSEAQTLSAMPWAGPVLCTGLLLAVPLGLSLIGRLLHLTQINAVTRKQAGLLIFINLITGMTALILGHHMGLVGGQKVFSGGTLYIVPGALMCIFALLCASALHRKATALLKERVLFLIATAPFIAFFLISAWLVQWIGLPADYLNAGQGFVIPVGFSLWLLIPASITLVYGQATREYN